MNVFKPSLKLPDSRLCKTTIHARKQRSSENRIKTLFTDRNNSTRRKTLSTKTPTSHNKHSWTLVLVLCGQLMILLHIVPRGLLSQNPSTVLCNFVVSVFFEGLTVKNSFMGLKKKTSTKTLLSSELSCSNKGFSNHKSGVAQSISHQYNPTLLLFAVSKWAKINWIFTDMSRLLQMFCVQWGTESCACTQQQHKWVFWRPTKSNWCYFGVQTRVLDLNSGFHELNNSLV